LPGKQGLNKTALDRDAAGIHPLRNWSRISFKATVIFSRLYRYYPYSLGFAEQPLGQSLFLCAKGS
jgi:hypothetical protein